MKPGDMVRLKRDPNQCYDWGFLPPRKDNGYFLREPESLNLFDGNHSSRIVEFSDRDTCIVLEVVRNLVLVVNPRYQTGLIHKHKIEVVLEAR